jgi:TPR repeat protein
MQNLMPSAIMMIVGVIVGLGRAGISLEPTEPWKQFARANFYRQHGNRADAAKLYYMAAQQGYAPAQNEIGSLYAHGTEAKQSDAEAVRW